MTSETAARIIKVDKSSLPDLKNACDDALKEYLESKGGYKQSHKHTDIKLVLGYAGCVFAAAGSYYGYIYPFELPATKFWTGVSVVLYYLFNVLMMAYAYLVEKDTVFTGSKFTPNGTQTISAGSYVQGYNPYYELVLSMDLQPSKGAKGVKRTRQEFSTAFRFWFDEDGVLDQEIFEADISKFMANTEATHVE